MTQTETNPSAVPATRIAEIEAIGHDAYWIARQMCDGSSDNFSAHTWYAALSELVADYERLARGASQDAARLQWIADHEDGTYNKSFRAAMEEEPGDGYFGATDPDFHTLTAPISHVIDNCMAADEARCAARSSQGGTE